MSSGHAALPLPRSPPLFLPRQDSPLSPWNPPSPHHDGIDSGYNSLTLPPINPEGQSNFDSPPRLPSPSFLPNPSRTREQPPPPSNQEAAQQSCSSVNNNNTTNNSRNNYQPHLPSRPRLPSWRNFSPDSDDELFDLPPPRRRFQRHTTPVVDLTSPSDMAPVTRKRLRDEQQAQEGRSAKHARTKSNPTSPKRPIAQLRPAGLKLPTANTELVDLADIEDDLAYAEFRKKQEAKAITEQQQYEATKPMKLSGLECVICMDPPTDLTVTHCGHLFCGECLNHALHTGNTKKTCPVCRTPISTTLGGRDRNKQPRNGVFLLQMKLKLSKKKGKQPARK